MDMRKVGLDVVSPGDEVLEEFHEGMDFSLVDWDSLPLNPRMIEVDLDDDE